VYQRFNTHYRIVIIFGICYRITRPLKLSGNLMFS